MKKINWSVTANIIAVVCVVAALAVDYIQLRSRVDGQGQRLATLGSVPIDIVHVGDGMERLKDAIERNTRAVDRLSDVEVQVATLSTTLFSGSGWARPRSTPSRTPSLSGRWFWSTSRGTSGSRSMCLPT